jgi:hypothetical protein
VLRPVLLAAALLSAALLIAFLGAALLIVALLVALFGLLLGHAASFAGGRPISPLGSNGKHLPDRLVSANLSAISGPSY